MPAEPALEPALEPAFLSPASVDEALEAMAEPDAVAVAGGTSIGLLVGQGLLAPTRLVWLGRIPELGTIAAQDGALVVGAGVTLRAVTGHPSVATFLPAVREAAAAVGNTRIRAVATVGGALAHADPRQDLPPALVAHRAEVEVAGRGGRRFLPLEELATGFMTTVLEPDELITAVRIPLVAGSRSVYRRYTPASADDYPTVSAAATATVARGTVAAVRLVIGGAGPTPYVVPEAEALVGTPGALVGTPEALAAIDGVADAAARRAEPVDDRLGSAAYKRRMVAVWARRVLRSCLCPEQSPPTR